MSVVAVIALYLLYIFLGLLIVRLIVDWTMVFARNWRPAGAVAAILDVAYSVTDPPPQAPPPPAAPAEDPTETALRTLLLAQRTADEAIAQAKAEAEQVVAQARVRASSIETEAQQQHAAALSELQRQREGYERQIE